MYDVETYTDPELLDILDLNNPTDRELEAKIVSLIRKYENMQNDSGNKLAKFFDDIYNHFFDLESDSKFLMLFSDSKIIRILLLTKFCSINSFSFFSLVSKITFLIWFFNIFL